MIKDEWKSLLGNKLMLLVIIAIVAIPLIYAGLFLKSMWDPYGNVDKLPVAVVNEDKPVEYNGSILNIGSDMVESLRNSGSMAFNFVDSAAAEAGLENGTYYMVITIPENFSANAATLMDDTPQKMELSYATNPGTNYIASKLSESALMKIKDAVTAQVTETYARAVFEQITAVGDGMQQAADGAGAIRDGLWTAQNGNQTITDNLDKLAASTLTFQDGTQTLAKGLIEYTNGVASVNDGAASLKNGSTQLVTGAGALSDGAVRLHDGAVRLTDGAGTLASGMQSLSDGAGVLIEGVNAIDSGAGQLKTGAEQLYGGAVQVESGAGSLSAGISSAKEGAQQLSDGAAGLVQGTFIVSNGLAQVQQKVSDNKNQLKSALGMISSAIGGSADGSYSIAQAVDAMTSDMELILAKQSASGQIDLSDADVQAAWMDIIKNGQILKLITKGNGTAENPGLVSSVNMLNSTLFGYQKDDGTMAAGAMDELEAGIAQLYAGMGGTDSENASTIVGGAKLLNSGADSLNSGLEALQAGASQLKTGTAQLADGAGVLNGGAAQLAAGTNELAQKSQTLSSGVAKLNDGAQALYSGASELANGSGTLADGAKNLYDGTVALDNGAATLMDGTGKLAANSDSLNTGAAQLADGATQLHDGSVQLYDGSRTLSDGMSQLYDGSSTLADSLADGAVQASDVSVTDDMLTMFAAPVSDTEKQVTTVENNGHAMAPYMMSVGLWVGALAFCLIYPLTTYRGELKSGFSWWAGKASVLYPVALLQGLVLIVLLHFLAGFSPAQMGRTVLFACLTAVTFTSIMYFFNITLGKVGSFLMLVFMVLQLAGSAGTYPVEISPGFVSAIHSFVPFTYTVNAFRSTISGGLSVAGSVCVMAVLFVVFTVLTIIRFHYMTKKRIAGEHTLYDWLEERGLA